MGRNDVPERWEKYTTCGSPIPETPFVAFKVPLSEVRWNWVNSKRNKDAQDKISHFKIFVTFASYQICGSDDFELA